MSEIEIGPAQVVYLGDQNSEPVFRVARTPRYQTVYTIERRVKDLGHTTVSIWSDPEGAAKELSRLEALNPDDKYDVTAWVLDEQDTP